MNKYEDAIKTMNERWKLLSGFQISIAKTPAYAASKTSFYSRIAQNYSDLNVPFLQNSRSNYLDAIDATIDLPNNVAHYAPKNEKKIAIPRIGEYQNFENTEGLIHAANIRKSDDSFFANYDALQRIDHKLVGRLPSRDFLEHGYSANSFEAQMIKGSGEPSNANGNPLQLNYADYSASNISSSISLYEGRYLPTALKNNRYGLYPGGLGGHKYDDVFGSINFIRNKHDVWSAGLKADSLLSPNYPAYEQRISNLDAMLSGHITDMNNRPVRKQMNQSSLRALDVVKNSNPGVSNFADQVSSPFASLQKEITGFRRFDSGFDSFSKRFAVDLRQPMNNVDSLYPARVYNIDEADRQLEMNYSAGKINSGVRDASSIIDRSAYGNGDRKLMGLGYPGTDKAYRLHSPTDAYESIINRTPADMQKHNWISEQRASPWQKAYSMNENTTELGKLYGYVSNLSNHFIEPMYKSPILNGASTEALSADNLAARANATGATTIGATAKGSFLAETLRGNNFYPSNERGLEFIWDMPMENFDQQGFSALGMPLQTTQNNITVTGNVFEGKQSFDPDMIADSLGKMIINEIQNSASGIYD